MSYDDWLTTPPPDNDPPEDEDLGCAICGCSVPRDQMYCGPSCEQADEEGWGDLLPPVVEPAPLWPSDFRCQRYIDQEEE